MFFGFSSPISLNILFLLLLRMVSQQAKQATKFNEDFPANPSYQGWEAKSIKTGIGHDLAGYQYNLYKDNKQVCIISNDGTGGEVDYHWKAEGAEEAYMELVAAEKEAHDSDKSNWDEYEIQFGQSFFNHETVANEIMFRALNHRETKRKVKKMILVQTPDLEGTGKALKYPKKFEKMGWEAFRNEVSSILKVDRIRIINEEFEGEQ